MEALNPVRTLQIKFHPKTKLKITSFYDILGMFFPNRNGITSAHLIAMNSCNVATNMEVSLEIKPRSQSGVLFAVSGSTGELQDNLSLKLCHGCFRVPTNYD